MISMQTSVSNLSMIGPVYASRLRKLDIETIQDLMYHIPHRYEDLSEISKIGDLSVTDSVTVIGRIDQFKNIYTKYGKKIQKAIVMDETGCVEVIWYNQPFLANLLRKNTKVAIAGRVKKFGKKLVFDSPDYEMVRTTGLKEKVRLVHSGRLVPIYPETAGVSSKWIRSRLNTIFEKLNIKIEESLPEYLRQKYDLCELEKAIYKIHFPQSLKEAEDAKKRLAFDELLTFQLVAQIRKKKWKKKKVTKKLNIEKYKKEIDDFIKKLPFVLTNAQKKASREMLEDISKNTPMNRLLEGDVGSGKTVVATILIYACFLENFRSILMAPTEILANQHYQSISEFLSPYNIKVGLITGNKKLDDEAYYDVIIGTHALISKKQSFKKVRLVIIDEQQRFGVTQRATLRKKGKNPHVLTMTATPIPRSIALTLYADLDLSVIDELPKGRKIVKTWVVPREKRKSAYKWIEKEVIKNMPHNQVFIICPIIEESETLESVKAVTTEYEHLSKKVFSNLKVGLLHGKLKVKEKKQVIKDFEKGVIDILVSTPVVEVGIDIPNATIMLIEASDRFGLSQLHQMRGRVGRGDSQAFCLLFTESDNDKTIKRLKLLEKHFNGPRLAEMDLKLRGAGEIFGTKQHGQLGLKIAKISDLKTIEETKKATKEILKKSSTLKSFPLLQERVQKYTIGHVAPD